MQILDPRVDVAGFWSDLAGADQRVLMTDYDGVVAPSTRTRGGLPRTRRSHARLPPHSVLTVLLRPELRQTAASIRLPPPDELIAFLQRWDDACARGAEPRGPRSDDADMEVRES